MSHEAKLPLSRPLLVDQVPDAGRDVSLTASEAERAALAKDFGLPRILALEGRFHVAPTAAGVDVTGTVDAQVEQICVVTLEPFETQISEPVEVSFSHETPENILEDDEDGPAIAIDLGRDPPDPIVDGRIDLGQIALEFLALGLDPHPRKPGIAFDEVSTGDAPAPSPFAVLSALKKPSDKGG